MTTIQQLEAENAALKAQLAAALKDAERWLFIREKSDSIAHGCWLVRDAYGLPVKDLQAAIDAAIAREKK